MDGEKVNQKNCHTNRTPLRWKIFAWIEEYLELALKKIRRQPLARQDKLFLEEI